MSTMIQDGDGKTSLADLPPELLKLIFSKLVPGDELDGFKVGDQLGWPERRLYQNIYSAGIPADVRTQLSNSTIVCKFKDQGWMLLHHYRHRFYHPKYDDLHRPIPLNSRISRFIDRYDSSTCCFNPTLPWPACFFRLPTLDIRRLHLPGAAAFSASPTDSSRDLRMLVFHSGDQFSILRIRRGRRADLPPDQEEQERYFIPGRRTLRVPVAAEYIEATEGGKFFILFENGDILIWEAEKADGLRTMLIAKLPLHSLSLGSYYRNNDQSQLLRVVAESLVMIWSWSSSSSSFQLVSAEENHHRRDDRFQEVEEGTAAVTTYLVGEDTDVKIENDFRLFNHAFFEFCLFGIPIFVIIVFMGVVLLGVE